MTTTKASPAPRYRGRFCTACTIVGLVSQAWPCRAAAYDTEVSWGRWTTRHLETVVADARTTADPGRQVSALSQAFLGTGYRSGTLIGSDREPERLVIDLAHVDCLTLIEYVEALRLAPRAAELAESLRGVRYRDGVVSYTQRKHFFSDWREDRDRLRDVTASIGGGVVRSVTKYLNAMRSLRYFLPGIAPRVRDLDYVPARTLLARGLSGKLASGDYLGLGTTASHLDVTHVGIAIRDETGAWRFRHASSRAGDRRVVDRDLVSMLQNVAGVMVLRPITPP
jgi:hypothetical protein